MALSTHTLPILKFPRTGGDIGTDLDNVLASRSLLSCIFTNEDQSVQLVVCRNVEQIRQSLNPLLNGGIRSASARQPLPKRPISGSMPDKSESFREDFDSDDVNELERTINSAASQPRGNVVVTDKNRKAIQRRQEKRGKREGKVNQLRRRRRVRSRTVVSESEDEPEHQPRPSRSQDPDQLSKSELQQGTDTITAWYKERKIPKDLSTIMLQHTFAIAGKEAAAYWRVWISTLRQGDPLVTPEADIPVVHQIDISKYPKQVQSWYQADIKVNRTSSVIDYLSVRFRLLMIELAKTFDALEDLSEVIAWAPRSNKKDKSKMLEYLYNIVAPGREPVGSVWRAFVRKINSAKNWQRIQARFGTGIIGLILPRSQTNDWIGQLSKINLEVWMDGIEKWWPQAITAGKAWDRMIIKADRGEAPELKQRRLEIIEAVDISTHDNPSTLFDETENKADSEKYREDAMFRLGAQPMVD